MTQISQRGAGAIVAEDHPARDVTYTVWTGGRSITGRIVAVPEPSANDFDFFDEVGKEVILHMDDGRKLRLGTLQADGKFNGAEFV